MSQTSATVSVAAHAAKCAAAKPTLLALPRSATVADLTAQLNCGKCAMLLIDDSTPASSTTLGDLHDCCSADDGLLHVTVVAEKTMGDAIAVGCCQTRVERDDGMGKKWHVARSCCCNVAIAE